MSDVLTKFGKRQDAVKAIYTDVAGAETLAPVRPGEISLVGNLLIDLHHRIALLDVLGITPPIHDPGADVPIPANSVEREWEKVRDLAQWEWSLIEGPLREKIEAAKAAAQ